MNDQQEDELSYYWRPIIVAYLEGATVLPPYLGLSPLDYAHICQNLHMDGTNSLHTEQHHQSARKLRQELREMRAAEVDELVALLNTHANRQSPYTPMMARVLAIACLGSEHLWFDLGMPERPRLSQLFQYYYPSLFALNTKNMRWKRFLYKQLCEMGGDYVCRAPSCEQCSSYNECFLNE